MWLAANQEAEDTLLPIRFPILKGLLGYRVSIIHPQNRGKFAAVRTKEDLKALSFGQGYGWPDVGILRSNGLNVVVTSKYENLFYMTEGGRFDGFPRGVLEPWVELRPHSDLGLTVDPHVLMIYPLPFYFFVAPENAKLAQEIHEALERALKKGSFDQYFYNHDMVKSALEQAKLHERTAVFELTNPTLPRETPLDREDYWFDIRARL
ncbi:diguanylate cyclase [Saccharophagus sp. K07]|uniref:diguanylate cyclase n=1 Tax=Saccharophagus sp. K07 TaxID=2283636 RepID=UPI0016529120|nr:diguanylate cyclase [Saccharophagus sp. K07]